MSEESLGGWRTLILVRPGTSQLKGIMCDTFKLPGASKALYPKRGNIKELKKKREVKKKVHTEKGEEGKTGMGEMNQRRRKGKKCWLGTQRLCQRREQWRGFGGEGNKKIQII